MDSEQKVLASRLVTAILAPAVLLLVLGAVLGVQILRMSEDARWLDHTDEVLSKAFRLQTEIVEQETGLRGYLLTEDRSFLDPFRRSRPLELVAQLRHLVEDNPPQVERVDELQHRYESWFRTLSTTLEGQSLAESRTAESVRHRRADMDGIRENLSRIVDEEHRLRTRRAEASHDSSTTTRSLFVVLFFGSAALLAYFSRRQLGLITGTYTTALLTERTTRAKLEDEAWTRAGQALVSDAVQGTLSAEELGTRVLATLSEYVGADVGAFFTFDAGILRRRAGFGIDTRAGGSETFTRGQGAVGRAAEKRTVVRVHDDLEDAPKIRTGTVERMPVELALLPFHVDNRCLGVVELGFLRNASERAIALFERVGETIAVAVRSAEDRSRLKELLEEAQRQAEELQTQQEELRVANEELEEQSHAVREAQAHIEERQEQLSTTNSKLELQTRDLEAARENALEKAAELERASRYKSEFLANMSHELRTPLNSSLILAKLLADNRDGNLNGEQIKFAQTIYDAGNDLLTLINDILDLSKIEAGKMDVNATDVPVARMADNLRRTFEPVATDKGLTFEVKVEPDTPETFKTDVQRVDQILRNLVSNALKFTDSGQVAVRIAPDPLGIRFSVRDTGIGIAPHQHELVFEAFRQADGASNRRYGGTGLGLSISRDLARLLGGDITVTSEVGKGSTFVLTLPIEWALRAAEPSISHFVPSRSASRLDATSAPTSPMAESRLPEPSSKNSVRPPDHVARPTRRPFVRDDRDVLDERRRIVLIIEDDARFAEILVHIAHERDFQCVVAGEADEGFNLATELVPSAIILDVNLPDHSGLSVLDRLKHTPTTRHVPVHVVTVGDHTHTALSMGAAAFIQKPVKREQLLEAFQRIDERLAHGVRRLLIVEDEKIQRESLLKLLSSDDVQIVAVGTVHDALDEIRRRSFDCIVTDLTLPDESGFNLLEHLSRIEGEKPPVIVYTGRSLSSDEEALLRRHSSSIIVKGARSPERLLDEVTLFLHQVESKMPRDRQRMLQQARDRDSILDGRTILVVEDDVRNIFALSSLLEPRGAKVVIARTGREALVRLEQTKGIDLVLMDIMMPEMDGLTAMKEIRKHRAYAKLPIIALTAKAMKDDQDACIQAGANDYISKPLDVEMLLSLIRVWLPR